MTPAVNQELLNDFTIVQHPSKTYALDIENGIIRGYCTGIEAVQQAVYKVLNTERYGYLIYSWNYGSELKELFGKPISLVYPEVKRRIEEGLKQDDRIKNVENFSFEKNKGALHVTFTVATTLGSFKSEVSVSV